MDKKDFLARLREGLAGLPEEDIEERIIFYTEMIDDRMEEGLTEEEAVLAVGPVQEIIAQIKGEIPHAKPAKSKRHLAAWEILLLIMGAPLWGSLAIALLAVVFALYVSLWSVVLSLWAVFGSLAACAAGVLIAGIFCICIGNVFPGLAMIAASLICAGFSIFLFWGAHAATRGAVCLTKKCFASFQRR